MNKMQQQVQLFHETYGADVGETPRMLSEERKDLRYKLIEEELEELRQAFIEDDIVEAYDALLDIIYIAFGTLVEMGLDGEQGFDEVQRSNMSKLGADGLPIISRGLELDGFPAGKVLKGPNYFKPDLNDVVAKQIIAAALAHKPSNPVINAAFHQED